MKTQTKEIQEDVTPQIALKTLVDGNARFVSNVKAQRDLKTQVAETSSGQYPFAVVLSCIDSRVPVELVFDQGIGDIFSARVAGNIVNEDILGSIEYACKVAGAKIVVVLGHTKCGAVTSACQRVRLGNITALLSKIKPAVNSILSKTDEVTPEKVEQVTVKNVELTIEKMKIDSDILADLEESGDIEIVGGVYSVETGKVEFFV